MNTREYVAILKDLIEEGQEVGMPVIGTSMEPFLKDQRDEIFFRRPQRDLKAGDLVFYQRKNGQYVMHRICRVRRQQYYLAGDHQTVLEGPVDREQIFAIITCVKRDGKLIDDKSVIWRFYAGFWRTLFPVRRFLLKGLLLKGYRIIGK